MQKYIVPVALLIISIIVMNVTKSDPLNTSPPDTIKNLEIAFNEQDVSSIKSLFDKQYLTQLFPNGDEDIKKGFQDKPLKYENLKVIEKSKDRAIIKYNYTFVDNLGDSAKVAGEFKLKKEEQLWFIYDITGKRLGVENS